MLTHTREIGTPTKRSAFSKQAEIEEVVSSILFTIPLLTPDVGTLTAPIICSSSPVGPGIFCPITKRIEVEPISNPAIMLSFIQSLIL